MLVTTGIPLKEATKTEIIDLSDDAKTCHDLKSYHLQARNAFGGLLQEKYPLICGGSKTNKASDGYDKCYALGRNASFKTSLSRKTLGAAAIATNNGNHLFVTGGPPNDNATEFVSLDDTQSHVKGPSLPRGVSNHCLVQINSSTLLLIGGYDGHTQRRETYFFNMRSQEWISGPRMVKKRSLFSCALFYNPLENGRPTVVAAGGYYDEGESRYSVEFFKLGSKSWTPGKS